PITSSSQLGAASTFGLNLYVPNYSTNYNSDRLSSTHQLDVRFDRFYNYEWGYINVYLELINLYGRRNPTGQDFSNTKPYVNGSNPALSYDTTNSPYIQSPVTGGHLLYLPYINFGIEARF
ncbi:MAG: porin, partial [Leptospira sp.]|nr:porin [Leptospira sp.]